MTNRTLVSLTMGSVIAVLLVVAEWALGVRVPYQMLNIVAGFGLGFAGAPVLQSSLKRLRMGWDLSRLVFIARTIITAAIITDCAAIGIVAYRWFAFSEAPGPKTWSGLIAITTAVVFALIQARDFSKE